MIRLRCFVVCAVAASIVGGCRRSGERIAGDPQIAETSTPPSPHVVQMSIGLVHACARWSDGTIRCFGWGGGGALGDSLETGRRATKPPIDHASWVTVGSAGYDRLSTCVVSEGVTRCFGWSEVMSPSTAAADCGVGTNRCTATPFVWEKAPANIEQLGLAVRDSAYGLSSWARRKDGTLLRFSVWGDRPVETIAGTTGNRGSAAAFDHACIVTADSTVRCMGANMTGALGDGTFDDRAQLVDARDVRDVVQVCAGAAHTCALHSGGTISCWGYGANGELGYAPTSLCSTPEDDSFPAKKDAPCSAEAHRATGIADAVEIACGVDTTCARRRDGSIACWGLPLGSAPKGDGAAARVVPGVDGAIGLAVGESTACAWFATGPIRCWGRRLVYDGKGEPPVDATPTPITLP